VNGAGVLRASVKPFGVAPVVAADAALCKFNCGKGRFEVRRSCAAEHDRHTADPENGYGERCCENCVEEAARRNLFSDEAERSVARGSARSVELERAVSCRRVDPWWRTKLDFGSGEPFDDLHWSSTLGQR